jgi:hypothetical protein
MSIAAPEAGLRAIPEVRAALGFLVLFLGTPLAQRAPGGTDAALLGAAVIVAVTAALVPLRLAALVAASGWALVTGFLVNGDGSLTFGHTDLAHLAVLLGAAVTVRVCARGDRRSRHRTASAPLVRIPSRNHVHV